MPSNLRRRVRELLRQYFSSIFTSSLTFVCRVKTTLIRDSMHLNREGSINGSDTSSIYDPDTTTSPRTTSTPLPQTPISIYRRDSNSKSSRPAFTPRPSFFTRQHSGGEGGIEGIKEKDERDKEEQGWNGKSIVVRIEVSDAGPGIRPSDADQLFEP